MEQLAMRPLPIGVILIFLFGSAVQESMDYSANNVGKNRIRPKPSYIVVGPSRVRPSDLVQLHVSIYAISEAEVTVRAIINRDGSEVVATTDRFYRGSTKVLQMKMPPFAEQGNYTLRVQVSAVDTAAVVLFSNESKLLFHPKHVSIFIHTSKYLYQKRDLVQFRVIAVDPKLLPVKTGSISIYMKDARGRTVRRWLAKQLYNGYYEEKLQLVDPCAYGTWKIKVEGFGYSYETSFLTEENHQERFDINLTTPAIVNENEYAVAGIMNVNLTSGHPASGKASVKVGLRAPGQDDYVEVASRNFSSISGRASFLFPIEELKKKSEMAPGTSVKLTATVESFFYGGTLSASVYSRVYSSATYLRFLGGAVRTFKPLVPFNAYIAVYGTDGSRFSQQKNRVVYISPTFLSTSGKVTSFPEGIYIIPNDSVVRYSIRPKKDTRLITIRVGYGIGRRDDIELVASRHYSRSGHFLALTTSTEKPLVNRYMVFTVHSTVWLQQVHYTVMSSGRLIMANTLQMKFLQKTFSMAISRDMVSNARMLVYGLTDDGELLTDSVTFHVDGIRDKEVEVGVNKGKDFSLGTVELTGVTEASTFIAFSVADYDMYRRQPDGTNVFFTTHAVEDEMRTYDDHANTSFRHSWLADDNKRSDVFFHAPTYAIDANKTFLFAGMTVLTDAHVAQVDGEHKCNVTKGYLPCFTGGCYRVNQVCDGTRQCVDGADELGCVDPTEKAVQWPDSHSTFSRIWPHLDQASWGWRSYYTKPDGRVDLGVKLPLRPGTWMVSAFSLHPQLGLAFCHQPATLDTTRPFHIVVEVDKKAARGEQLGVRVAVFNNWDQNIEALLTLRGSEHYVFIEVAEKGVVSSYDPRTTAGDVQTMVYLKSGQSRLVHFPVLPTIEKGKIEIVIEAETFIGKQIVKKSVSIRMDGITNIYHTPYFINLVSQGSIIIPDLEIPVPEIFIHPEQRQHLYVPGSAVAKVVLVGDVMGPGLTSSYMSHRKVSDYFEGTGNMYLFTFAFNLQWTKFLKATNQISDKLLRNAVEGLTGDMQTMSIFIQRDGGYAMRRKRVTPSVWMTGHALEVLALASEPEWEDVLFIDVEILNQMALWLISKQDPETGAFHEEAAIYDNKLQSNLTDSSGRSLDMAVTAYAIVGLTQARTIITGEARSKAESSRLHASRHLAAHFDKLADPFTVCLVTYALHVAAHRSKGHAFTRMRQLGRVSEYTYWSDREIPPDPTEIINNVPFIKPRPMPRAGESSAVQATAYALMVYLRNNYFVEAEPIMMWLQIQRRNFQYFDGPQDTIVALQALREYGERITNRDLYNVLLKMESTSSPNWKRRIHLQRGNFLDPTSLSVPRVYGSVKVAARGTGLGLLQLRTEVNVEYPHLMRQPSERSFDLEVDRLLFYGRNASHFHMRVCYKWLRPDVAATSGDAILEIDVPTGFHVRKSLLRAENKNMKHVKRVRYTNHRVVLYVDKVEGTRSCASFSAERWYPVANGTIQNFIRIWDTSEPAFQNTTLYTTFDLFHLHICQVCGSFQCPYCPFYNTASARTPPRHFTWLTGMVLSVALLM